MYEDNSGFEGRKNIRYDLTDAVTLNVKASDPCGAHNVKINIPNRVYPASSQMTPS
jgi:hypothetical protein